MVLTTNLTSRLALTIRFFGNVRSLSRAVSTTTSPVISTPNTSAATTTTQIPTAALETAATRRPTILFDNNSSRWKTQQVRFGLDRNFKQSIRQQHHPTRLLHPFSHTSSTYDFANTYRSLFLRTTTTTRQSNSGPLTQISNRTSDNGRSATNSRLSQLDFCHSQKEWRNQTSLQSEASQPILRPTSFQNGDNQGSGTPITQNRLLSINRSFRCVPAHPCSPKFPQISSFQVEIASLPIYDYPFWLSFGSLPLYKNLSTYPRMGSNSGYQSVCLFGRLDTRGRIQEAGTSTHQHARTTTATTRLGSEHQEICLIADAQTRTPRLLLGYYDHDSLTTSKEDPRPPTLYQANHQQASLPNTSSDTQPAHNVSLTNFTGADVVNVLATLKHDLQL